MAGNGHILLREAREAVSLSREELGNRVGVSKATVQRWEYGESLPESSDVARIGHIVGDNSLWPRWMCETDEEYARRHPYTDSPNHAAMAVINAGYQISDVSALTAALGRDLMDGKADDEGLKARYIKEAEEAAAALNAAVAKLKKGG